MSTTEVGRRSTSGKPDSIHRDGVSLEAVIESARRLDELSCARLLGNVAELVHTAQKAGQPLGTVTPASIVVLPDGTPRLAPGTASPGYTAPERLRGGVGDRRTDVFSLGAVLWEVLAHERLFDGGDDEAIKRAVLERPVRPPSELNANVPAELDAICKRALARDPADRYQSARVMAAEIDAVLGDAGYPESNEQIAAYLARAFAAVPPPAEPAPTGRAAPTLPPPPLKPAARVAPESGPVAAPMPTPPVAASTTSPPPPFAPASTMLGSAPSATKAPASEPAPTSAARSTASTSATAPTSATASTPPASKSPLPTTTMLGNAPGALGRAAVAEAAAAAAAASAPSTTTRPPLTSAAPATTVAGSISAPPTAASPLAAASASAFAPAVPENTLPGAAPPSATKPTASKPPPFAPAAPASAPGSGPIASTPPGTLPSFSAQPRPPAPTATLGSPGAAPSAPPPSVTAPFGSQAVSASVLEPAFKPVALPASAPAKLARTEMLGSAAPPAMPASGPPAMPASGPPAMPTSEVGPHPTLPGRMEAPPMLAQVAVEARLPGPGPTAHPQPPRTIANAETLATPQLPAHLATPAMPSTAMSGAAPAGSPASMRDTIEDVGAFGAEHHADPAEGSALHQAEANATSGVREGRDVLAGWGWSTGSVQALDDDMAEDAQRRGRRNLLIAIGGALGVVIILAVVAFAFSGAKKPDDSSHGALARPSPNAPISATGPETPTPAPAPTQPGDPATPSAEPVKTEPPATSAEPPKGESATAPGPAPAQPGPGAVVPPRFDSAKPEPPAAEPSKPEPAKGEAPKSEAKAEPPKAEPPKAEPKVAVAPKPPAPKAEPPRAEVAKAAEVKKPPEPKKVPEKAVKHPAEKVARSTPRALPVDPYAAPEREQHKVDPSAAYRTGLQQYARGDTAGALATFRGSLATNPGFAPTWRGIGLVYEKMGNKGQARAAFKRYLQLAPTAGDADQIRDRMERLGS